MRARAPAGRSVPEGHGASAELSRAPGICALLATPERTQHSLRPPPQVTGACSSFHPCPPPREPTPLPHPLPGDSLALVAVSLLPEFRPAAPGGETQSHVSALGTRNMLRVAGGIEVLQPAGQGGAPAWTGRPPPASSLSQPCPAPQSSPDGHHSAFGWVKFSARS